MESVYVANLPPDIRIKDIDEFFRPFGKLVYIDVNHRANPVYAYVQFDSARNAFDAVKARHGYEYEGFRLKLRLVENEVSRHGDAILPPAPPMFNNSYEPQYVNGGFGNNRMVPNYSTNSSGSQWPINNGCDMRENMEFSSNWSNMQQLNIMPYLPSNRPNMDQQLSNMQNFSNTSRSNMQHQYSNYNSSSIEQQYSDISRSTMPQSANFVNRSDMAQQNMTRYSSGLLNEQQQLSNTSRSNIPKLQDMNIQCPDNISWNESNTGMTWDTGNYSTDSFSNNYNSAGSNVSYNPNNGRYNKPQNEDQFSIRLSGSGRKWYNRYILKGYSSDIAFAKALEHKTVPYVKEDFKNNPIQNNPTNVALETIGNTIMSLLSTNQVDNIQQGCSNNVGSSNVGIAGPSSSVTPQVSKRQYLESLSILKRIREKRVKSNKDRISVKYHTQIIKDYQKCSKSGASKESRSTNSKNRSLTEKEISELMIKQKAKLLKRAREIENESRNKKRVGGAYKKRTKILLDHGFLELEAKSLAWNPLNMLEKLLSLKKEYDLLAKRTVFIPASKTSLTNAPKAVVYRNDLKYLDEYAKHRIKGLSKTILYRLKECLKRIHTYEKNENLPLTENKFTKLLHKITSREGFFKDITKTSPRKVKNRKNGADAKDVKQERESKTPEVKKSS